MTRPLPSLSLLPFLLLFLTCSGGDSNSPTSPVSCDASLGGEWRYTVSSACSPLTTDTVFAQIDAASCAFSTDLSTPAQKTAGVQVLLRANLQARTATLTNTSVPCGSTDSGQVEEFRSNRIVVRMTRADQQGCCSGNYVITFGR